MVEEENRVTPVPDRQPILRQWMRGRLAPAGWKSYDQVMSSWKQLCDTYPGKAWWEKIGTSYKGLDIIGVGIGNPEGRKVMLVGCTHGGEAINQEVLWLYANWLLKKKESVAGKILEECFTIIVPILNVDGYYVAYAYNGWGRKTEQDYLPEVTGTQGVDINRNCVKGWCGGSTDPTRYDYKGPSALSEVEAQAINKLVYTFNPRWFIDMHTGDPFVIYRFNGAGYYGKTIEYDNFILATIAKYREIAGLRGLNPNEYKLQSLGGPAGRVTDDAIMAGAYGLIWEFHSTEVNMRDNDPVFADIATKWFPKFLPMAIAISEVEYTQPSGNLLPLILAVGFIIVSKGVFSY